jgi:hypothetical protein
MSITAPLRYFNQKYWPSGTSSTPGTTLAPVARKVTFSKRNKGDRSNSHRSYALSPLRPTATTFLPAHYQKKRRPPEKYLSSPVTTGKVRPTTMSKFISRSKSRASESGASICVQAKPPRSRSQARLMRRLRVPSAAPLSSSHPPRHRLKKCRTLYPVFYHHVRKPLL